MPIQRGVFRTGIWRCPGAPSAAWSPDDIAASHMLEWHRAAATFCSAARCLASAMFH